MSERSYRTEYSDQIFDLKLKPLVGQDRCMITLTDVTEFERISKERQLYYEAFQSSVHGMMITDAHGSIEYVNPKFEKIYGYPMSEARGKQPNILNPGPSVYYDLGYSQEEYTQLFNEMWTQIKDPQIGYWEGEIPNVDRNGNIIWVHLIINAIYDREGTISNYLAIPVDVSETRRRELNIRLDIYRTITELAELRDNETGQHLNRVGIYSRLIAEGLGLSRKVCNDIETFAPYHDIGKVGISDLILLAERRLTEEEFATMKTHTTLGYRLLQGKPTLEMAADIAHGHHEKYDGSGYPQQLAGKSIPLCARITAIVDVYDALRSKRPYKEPWPHDQAMEEISSLSGTHFDPEVVETFLGIEGEIEKVAIEYAD
jgi:PAS domain S-box-containing protein